MSEVIVNSTSDSGAAAVCLSVCKNHAMRLMGSSGSPLHSTVYRRSMREKERERERACVINVD